VTFLNFDKLVLSKLTPVFNNIIDCSQHGFRNSKFVATNLLVYYTDLVEKIESGGQVDAIHTDLRKSFDIVDFDLLINK
jgi:hypothetical protein